MQLRFVNSRSFHLLTTICFILFFRGFAVAHDGPPFAIIVDQQVGPCVISVWTDPDIGRGSFFIMTKPSSSGCVPDNLTVHLLVQPVSGRLPEEAYRAAREDQGGNVQYNVYVNFDVQEQWRVRVKLDSPQGSGETTAFVEPTPPGLGRWDLLLYLLPFLAVGFLWLRAFFAKKQKKSV